MRAVALLGPNADVKDVAPFAAAARIAIPVDASLDPNCALDAVLIFGGDGTVHRHLPALVTSQVPALVVPTGSGNDFARALEIKKRSSAMVAWRVFCTSHSNVRTIDVGEITPTAQSAKSAVLFCCVAGAGIDADVNRRANLQPRWLRAHGGYALSVATAAFGFRPQNITVEYESDSGVPGQVSDPALMCAFANARAYGHGMRIAPRAELDDGLLDLVFVRKTGAGRLLTLFPTVYFGAHLGIREVEYRRVRRLRIVSESPLDIYADGEFICRTPAEVTVRPNALNVIGNW